jgi:hypothetical protein
VKLILILTLYSIINAQLLKWESPDLISMTRTLPIDNHKMFETKKLDKSAKLKAAAYSLILPGWGQYKNE